MQALRPAPAPGAGSLATPAGAISFPQTPWDVACLLSADYAGAAPCTRAGGQPPGNPRWGHFISPDPLKFRIFAVPDFLASCLYLATAVEQLLPIGTQTFYIAQAGHELVERSPYQK
jgi:hypothetical protein